MAEIQVTLDVGTHDRTQLLWDGRVKPNGYFLDYFGMRTMELFFS